MCLGYLFQVDEYVLVIIDFFTMQLSLGSLVNN